ncbi:MAG: hypothetical protein V1887_01325 [Candidatus Aenigmatarchaeota archaeon]
MKLQVLEEKNNPALQRRELKVAVDYEGAATPKLEAVANELAKHFGADQATVEIRKLIGDTGHSKGIVLVNVWANPDIRESAKAKKRAKPVAAPAK